ncbi:hypothetical protein LPC08_16495 [Roseomonas sp. OT10]|uniref:hypothetical protein n=1 Tax=Roseomonas cutis TaxID=2897332 RepID=UPI001E505681|nr:hypothetical protein [Roseomonas sp. OT10]UFN47606.1 hypothetical protein LPC08_16495 [Roseomonas sp. OT10]
MPDGWIKREIVKRIKDAGGRLQGERPFEAAEYTFQARQERALAELVAKGDVAMERGEWFFPKGSSYRA